MILQSDIQAAQNAMELAFNTKDVIYIVTIIASVLTTWFKMNYAVKRLEEKRQEAEEKYSTAIREAKHSRTAIRKHFDNEIRDVRKEAKDDRDATQQEFKEINNKLSKILGYLEK